ncbi:hypothetical protein IOD13_16275 [Brevibacterium casei]|nr:hypothetical protein [Brevibacterium casei]
MDQCARPTRHPRRRPPGRLGQRRPLPLRGRPRAILTSDVEGNPELVIGFNDFVADDDGIDRVANVVVALGDPAVSLARVPDCGTATSATTVPTSSSSGSTASSSPSSTAPSKRNQEAGTPATAPRSTPPENSPGRSPTARPDIGHDRGSPIGHPGPCRNGPDRVTVRRGRRSRRASPRRRGPPTTSPTP